MRNCFVGTDTQKYPLSEEGEWIVIKKQLNNGEKKQEDEAGIVHKAVGDKIFRSVDWGLYEMLRATIWLTAWHIHDSEGNVPPLCLESIQALDPVVFEEINKVIFTHRQKVEDAKKVLLNPKAEGPNSIPTLQ
jgi:hypothetical protein